MARKPRPHASTLVPLALVGFEHGVDSFPDGSLIGAVTFSSEAGPNRYLNFSCHSTGYSYNTTPPISGSSVTGKYNEQACPIGSPWSAFVSTAEAPLVPISNVLSGTIE